MFGLYHKKTAPHCTIVYLFCDVNFSQVYIYYNFLTCPISLYGLAHAWLESTHIIYVQQQFLYNVNIHVLGYDRV